MAAEAWHAEPIDEGFVRLQSRPAGLSEQEAQERLQRFGPNQLDPPKPVSPLKIFTDQLRSVVVLLLVAAAGVALALGERIDAAAIAVVLAINTLLGFVTELRARHAMAALLKLDVPRAFVLRDGQVRAVDAHTLVPGDVIELNRGQQVPADGRVIEAADLRTDEAALTGESLPVSKSVEPLPRDTLLAERTDMVYKGTTVVAGTARVVVTATGKDTELGRIGVLVGGVREERAPLERRLDELGRRLVWIALAVAGIVAALGAFHGAPLGLVVQTGIALAVAAVPEALPAVATIALAVGVWRMAHRKALVRRLAAVEALGSTTVICTDKTRTLTSGDMTVARIWTAGKDIDLAGMSRLPEGEGDLRRLLEVAALATQDAQGGGPGEGGDPVDKALLEAAARFGIDRARLLELQRPAGIVPFSSERKLMASFHRKERGTSVRAPSRGWGPAPLIEERAASAGAPSRGWGPAPLNMDGKVIAYVKGAPQQVVDLAGSGPGGESLDDRGRRELMAANDNLARAGLRVLALASGAVEQPAETALKGLMLVGFVGLIDPPAPGVKETIARLRAAGLRTVMLTGDQRLTAEAIGRELGVLSDDTEVISGSELDALSRQELEARVSKIGVFSRITPEHKLAIVSALQARGEIVAMLGDGVNDAAALKKADVGVAMGKRGTDVAKEAASIVLQDDRFETIAAAVEEGRVIFDNIRRFVFYLFSCNLAEVLTLLIVGLIGLPIPLLPLQILWLNMVTDTFPALALAMEPGDPDVMNRPPRNPQEAILSRRFLTSILVYASLITACVLGAFLWAHEEMPERAVTVTFMTLALAQIFHLVNARAGSVMSLAWFVGNRYAVGAIVVSAGLQLAAMYVEPLARTLRVVPLGPQQWAVVLVVSALPAIVGQGLRIVRATGPAAAG